MIDTSVMSAEQTRHLSEVKSLWQTLGPLLRRKRELVGGLQWKKVNGNEYLYRYQPDPITKQKRSGSVGRRSPETEALYEDFIGRRDRLASDLAGIEPALDTQRRVAKALRVARLPDDAAEVLTTLWEDNLLEHVLAMGEIAVTAYEVSFSRLFPSDREAEMIFLVPDDEEVTDAILSSLQRIDRTYKLIGNAITGEKGPRVWTFQRGQILHLASEQMHEDELEMFEMLLDEPAEPVVAMAKSGPAPITAIHPVAFAVLGLLQRNDRYRDRATEIASTALGNPGGHFGVWQFHELMSAALDEGAPASLKI